MKKIVYVGYYDNENKRHCSPAAITMMDYVIKATEKGEHPLLVISPAQSKNKEYIPQKETKISENTTLIYSEVFPFANKKNYIKRLYNKIRRSISFSKLLDEQICDGDTVVVYHSLSLIKPILKIKKKKNIKLVVQVCEIYADVVNNEKTKKKELDFFKKADAYIFSTTQLEKMLNEEKKDFAVCLGTYKTEKEIENNCFEDGKIHILYAGTLDIRKGGMLAAAAAEFLDEKYCVHILGFGSDEEKKVLSEEIDKVRRKTTCQITYDGCFLGEEYIKFIQKCHIGLSTQDPNAEFNATSFPSKILAYMANGLRVVSIKIPAIEASAVSGDLYYYDEQTPQKIAEAIKSIDFNDGYCGKKTLEKLDDEFTLKVQSIVEN